ncbi:MAG TPA: CvpA family protein [Desulfobacterales bacterium]|nr:CvpA family protein [Desulfobacterales bacterium]
MNPFDIVIIVILSFCLVRGIFRGLVKEVSAIIGVLAGFYAAYTYYAEIAKLLSKWISNVANSNILSFLILFVGVLVIVNILGIIIKYILKIASLGWIDRVSGAGFGIIKGVLIVSILLIMLTAFLPKGSPVIRNSMLSPYITMVSERLAKVIPQSMKDQFSFKLKDFKETWKKQN